MTELDHKLLAERWIAAVPTDEGVLKEICHPQYTEDWPQSGESFRSLDQMIEIHREYPLGVPGKDDTSVRGEATSWVVTPMLTLLRITGSGNLYFVESTTTYPDGKYHVVSILEFRDDLISKATTYFAKDYEAPGWRADRTDRI